MSTIMGPSDYVLEITNLYYSGPVEPQTWLKQVTGTTRSGMILRDVSLEVGSSNMMAILGSKGSGKKALLDVIACRANGPKKGYVLLNGVTINRRLFQSVGTYITGFSDQYLIPGLTVYQTLNYEACLTLKVPSSVRKIRVRQILADVALTPVASTNVDNLTASEKRRLAIGIHLMKDPVLVLADEPAWGLDPLNTYFIISILSNYAKKYGRIVILTMEKPRSDIFPFLDRVTYLCLGDVVFSGNTRNMLDYFRSIGFPCPEIENALIYYLCLATVDRRSHEKFIESSNQIGLLVDKFKMEGSSIRKEAFTPVDGRQSVTPLNALGKPSVFSKMGALILRNFASTFMFNLKGLHNIFFHLLFLPLLFFIMWIFYFGMKESSQSVFVTLNGLVLNSLVVTYAAAIWSTVMTFDPFRKRYYQESRDGYYSGPIFLVSHSISCIPFTIISCLIGSRILFECTGLSDITDWLLIYCIILSCYWFAQQQTYGILLLVKNRILSTALIYAFQAIAIALASGTVRSFRGLPDWLYYVTYVAQPRYAGAFLNEKLFLDSEFTIQVQSPYGSLCTQNDFAKGCRYLNGTHYLHDRYYHNSAATGSEDLDLYLNFGICFVFPVVSFILNAMLYALPLPVLIKQKFRD